jgi:hypothetical protein
MVARSPDRGWLGEGGFVQIVHLCPTASGAGKAPEFGEESGFCPFCPNWPGARYAQAPNEPVARKRPKMCGRQAYVSSNTCARFRYLLRAATSAIRAVRRCCTIGFWKSRLLHKMPSSRQSCFAFSMISETVGSDTVGSKVSGRTVPDNSRCWHEQFGRRFAILYRSVRQPCPRHRES